MNPLQQYVNDPKICIQCDTIEEAFRIESYMLELGGRKLVQKNFKTYSPFILFIENVSRVNNCFGDIRHAKSNNYTILHSSQIKDPNNEPDYQVF